MSFTNDELQSFNTILEQKLSAQRREMERALDQRINAFRRDIEQRLVAGQQDILRNLTLKLAEQQNGLDSTLSQKLNTHQTRIISAITGEIEQRQQQFESVVDRMLAAQLLGIEQLLSQHLSQQSFENAAIQASEPPPHLEAIEVQTELPWEDLLDVIGKALDERLSVMNQSTQAAIKNLEQYLSARLHSIRNEFLRSQGQLQPANANIITIQEVLQGIEHLERIIESMQVAMTSNHALLSNRLFHHQQLPLDRAHSNNRTSPIQPNGTSSPGSIARERVVEKQLEAEERKE